MTDSDTETRSRGKKLALVLGALAVLIGMIALIVGFVRSSEVATPALIAVAVGLVVILTARAGARRRPPGGTDA